MIEMNELEAEVVGLKSEQQSLDLTRELIKMASGASALKVDALVPRKMTVLERDQARARLTEDAIVHPMYESCMQSIASMHAARLNKGTAPRGMLITGPTGSGKSTIAKAYAAAYPRREEEERTVIPVLYVELPGQPTAKVIAERILNAMHDPFSARGAAEQKLQRIRKLLSECRVELLIFDEFQHVTDNLDTRACDIAADTLKNLMNETGVPCVFLGGPSCRGYFVRNQQLGRRCTPKVHLSPFGIATKDEKVVFQKLLKALESRLPFTQKSALVDVEVAASLWYASFGLFGQLTQLVGEALDLALQSGANTLTTAHLHRAFAKTIYPGCHRTRNPFDEDFNSLQLVGPGEPFCGFEV